MDDIITLLETQKNNSSEIIKVNMRIQENC